jgi:hypothetical protein
MKQMNQQAETETVPAMEIHVGEVYAKELQHKRHCIIWLNGKRWEGTLTHVEESNHAQS